MQLPKGFTQTVTSSGTQVTIRMMVDGVRYSLGPFTSLSAAIKAKADWMRKEADDFEARWLQGVDAQSAQLLAIEVQGNYRLAAELETLESAGIDPSTLDWNQQVTIDGKVISAKAVTAFLNKLYDIK